MYLSCICGKKKTDVSTHHNPKLTISFFVSFLFTKNIINAEKIKIKIVNNVPHFARDSLGVDIKFCPFRNRLYIPAKFMLI